MMKYKGFSAVVEYDYKSKIFHGECIGLKDIITFQGTTVDELEQAFYQSVDDYLIMCSERNETPEKSFSGVFNLRIDPKLHMRLSLEAKNKDMSLNSYICEKLMQD